MTKEVIGTPLRFDVSALKADLQLDFSTIAALEYWCYVRESGIIKKFSFNATTGCTTMIKTDPEHPHFWLDTTGMESGLLRYDIYYAETNAELASGIWAPKKSVETTIELVYKPISARV